MRSFSNNKGFFLLAILLIAWGLATLIPGLGGLSPVLAILAIVSGVFILLDR